MEADGDPSEGSDHGIALGKCTRATPKKYFVEPAHLTLTENRVLSLVSQSETNREIPEHLH